MTEIDEKGVNSIVVIFPYNQHKLFVPNKRDWARIRIATSVDHPLLIVSPNALKLAQPIQDFVVMHHEMILNFWQEIKEYVNQFHIQNITVITTDIDKERVKRDYSLIFSDQKLIPNYITIVIPLSFWKLIYRIRERIVLSIPIRFYKWLGRYR